MSNQVTSSVVRLINQSGTVVGIGYLVVRIASFTAHICRAGTRYFQRHRAEALTPVVHRLPFVERGRNRSARVTSWRTVYQNSSLPLDGMEDVAVLDVIDDSPAETSNRQTL